MRSAPFFKFLFGRLRCPAAALCILFSLVSGFFAAEAVAVETAAPAIRSAAEIAYPPFSIVDEKGRASGFSVELLRSALSALGREVTFRTGPWAEVRGWLEKGEIDALPLVGRTPERESLFDFTFPYMTLHGAIVVRKTTSDIWDLGDLAGRNVVVMKGDNAEEFLRRKERGITIHTTNTFQDALRELSEGHHDAVFIQRLVALRLIQEGGITNVKVVNRPVEEFRQDFCFAVKEGDRDTLALLNEGLSIVMADGTYRHLHAKWFASMELPTHRRIVVGGDHNFPPYEYLDENGRPAGYNVDLTRAIAQEVGLDVEIRLGPWAESREALARGEIDVIQGMFYSPQRDLTFDLSPPHAVNHCVAVVRQGQGPPPANVEELMQKRIVVQEGDIMHDFAVEKGLEAVFAADAQEDALRQLAQGKHDVALVSRLTALYWIKQYGWENLVVGKKPFVSHEYCYAVPKNQKALLAQFSEGLNILEETGEYRRIQEKWFGVYEDLPPTLAEIVRHAALIAGPLLLLLFGFFLWSWSLRKQVAARTEALRKSEEFQRAMVDCSPVAIYSVDFGGRVMA
ncbi:MAG: transporter substrate-binding domain-containing protein, partial [Desulfobacterales bacterium]|nr:transporter substrate-binding domain-containing protein [Desulfobacterales bacterium]